MCWQVVSDYSPTEMGFGMFATYYSTIEDTLGPSVFHRYGQVMDSGQDFSMPCSYRCGLCNKVRNARVGRDV